MEKRDDLDLNGVLAPFKQIMVNLMLLTSSDPTPPLNILPDENVNCDIIVLT